ncbi:MAG: mandelate racemase/muconate lactonizing enzyme family protein [Pirellulaceae bacterium]|jgi:galactonate dehydratase|nr:mandelate racemase/muconate lactonizing enzyme family protein [Pirellulaceae bacterium]MDP7017023.1 mandelate racemase/muconate lactonizing enzyme family protein [Pirellulaceae bacterium]
MKITDLQVKLIGLGFRNCIVVELHTDAGLIGRGETVLKRHSRTVEASLRELSRYLVGKDPGGIEDHYEKMYRDSFWVGGPMHASAISAVDVALWDLKGQALGAPIHTLLGGPTRQEIPVYCHCPAGDSPAEFASNLRQRVEWGHRAAKTTLPVFYGSGGGGYSGRPGSVSPSWKETEYLPTDVIPRITEFFAAAREEVGGEFELAVDCHGRLSPALAHQLADGLAPYRLLFIEEPIPPEHAAELSAVSRRSVTPIAAGERMASIHEVRPFLQAQAVAYLQVDFANCGGITSGKKIAALAESHHVGVCPHNPNGPLATAAAVHLLAAIPNAFMLETIGSPDDWELQRRMSPDCLTAADGVIRVPDRPGLGVSLADDAEQRFPYQPFAGWR